MYSQEEKDKMAMKNSTIDKFGDRYGVNDTSPKQQQRIGRIAENNKGRAEKVMNKIDDRNYQKLNKQTFAEKKEAKMQKRQDVGSAIVKKKEEKQASQAKVDRLGRIYKAGGDINKKIYDDF